MKGKKLLLVEDNRNLATALSIRLSAAGYRVILARTIAEAISLQLARKPDVLLLDINLPDGSGFTLVDQIQKNPNTSVVPIVFLTASSSSSYRERALEYGPVAFLEKPFNTDKLITAIEQSIYSTSQFAARSGRKAA